MQPIIQLLAENQLLLLFSVIGLGFLFGNLRFFGFSLGVAAVLFVGIAFGALDKRLALPEYMYILGLVLFVYAIGLQSGPSFFSSFNKKGLRINIFALLMLFGGALVTVIISYITGISAPYMAGLFCGALTNTPALAASVETVKSLTTHHPAELREMLVNGPVITYGLTYPFGVLGIILWFFMYTKFFKIDFAKEEAERIKESGNKTIEVCSFKITNAAVIGKRLDETLKILLRPGFVISRMHRNDTTFVPSPSTVFAAGDLLMVVGTKDALERARVLFGEITDVNLADLNNDFEYRRVFVSNEHLVGKKIRDLNLIEGYSAIITRVRRGDVDFVPDSSTVLELGDRVRVVTQHDNIPRITQYFGDSMKAISETDFLSISLGIVIGVFVGMFPVPLPNGSTFKLGFAGGPLVVALILGRLQRTGSITWTMPFNANLVLRQVGLVFFLAGIGTKAGGGFSATFQSGGWGYIGAGAIITTCVSFFSILLGYKYLKLPMSAVMGIMSGLGTQPACLAYANQLTKNEQSNMYYATVYPASMIAKIILVQILVTALWR